MLSEFLKANREKALQEFNELLPEPLCEFQDGEESFGVWKDPDGFFVCKKRRDGRWSNLDCRIYSQALVNALFEAERIRKS